MMPTALCPGPHQALRSTIDGWCPPSCTGEIGGDVKPTTANGPTGRRTSTPLDTDSADHPPGGGPVAPASDEASWPWQWPVFAVMVVFAVGNALRLSSMAVSSDEAVTVGTVRELSDVISQGSGALYAALLNPVVSATLDPVWLRLPSLVAATASIWVVARIGHLVGGRWTAVFSAAVYASGWYLSRYAIEAQGYALSVLLVTLAWWGLLEALRAGPGGRRHRWWWLFVVAALLAPFAQGMALVHLPLQVVVVAVAAASGVAADRRFWLARLAWVVPAMVLVGVVVLRSDAVVGVLPALDGGQLTPFKWAYLGPRRRNEYSTLALVSLGLVMVALAVARSRRRAPAAPASSALARPTLVPPTMVPPALVALPLWALGPLVVVVGSSLVEPAATAPYSITALPGIALLIAYGISRLPWTAVRLVILAVTVALLLNAQHMVTAAPVPWDRLAAWTEANANDGDGLLAPTAANRAPFDVAWAQSDRRVDLLPVNPGGRVGVPSSHYPPSELAGMRAVLRRSDHEAVFWVAQGRFEDRERVLDVEGSRYEVADGDVLQVRGAFVARLTRKPVAA